jgi:hypothetical protein
MVKRGRSTEATSGTLIFWCGASRGQVTIVAEASRGIAGGRQLLADQRVAVALVVETSTVSTYRRRALTP